MLSQIPIFFFHLFITIFRYQETKPLLTLLQQSRNEVTKKNSRKPVKKKDQKYIMKDSQKTKSLGLKPRNNDMKNLIKPAKKYIFKNSLELKNTKKKYPLLYVMTLRGICTHVASLVHSVHSVLIFSVYC